jgi:heme-degrading monooxygenase HmoA
MIRVIVERQFKRHEEVDAVSLLIEMRSKALQAHGYIGGETLHSIEDPSVWVTVSTWADEASWRTWASSKERKQIERRVAPPYYFSGEGICFPCSQRRCYTVCQSSGQVVRVIRVGWTAYARGY